ncbi:MAG: SUMF1/EgtB/PvdO family nonheme iron enzyme [Actinomycetota bacterium]
MKIIEVKLSHDVNLEMVEIPAGSFLMGSSDFEAEKRENETPQHKVNLQTFYLGKFSVTQEEWFAVMKSLPETNDHIVGLRVCLTKNIS